MFGFKGEFPITVHKLTIVLFCLIFALLSFARAPGMTATATRLSPAAAQTAWTGVSFPLPPDTPGLIAGGLVVENEVNGWNKKVILTANSSSGLHLLRGRTCGDEEVKLGQLWLNANQNVPGVYVSSSYAEVVFDSAAMRFALPFAEQPCSIEAVNIEKGQTRVASVDLVNWRQTDAPKIQIGAEGLTKDGLYYISVSGLPSDATVILGRHLIGKVQATPAGSLVLFSPEMGLPGLGPTTLTACSKTGKCSGSTFERKLEVPYPGGKG